VKVHIGFLASITISLLYHKDQIVHGLANANVASFVAASFIVQPFNANAVVLA
jgi:hypothetical protein